MKILMVSIVFYRFNNKNTSFFGELYYENKTLTVTRLMILKLKPHLK